MGTSAFNKAILTIHALDEKMTCTLPPTSIHSWTLSQFDNYLSIDLGNCYFSFRSDVLSDDIILFLAETDPTGILTQKAGNTFVYALDNQVQYYSRVKDWDDNVQ